MKLPEAKAPSNSYDLLTSSCSVVTWLMFTCFTQQRDWHPRILNILVSTPPTTLAKHILQIQNKDAKWKGNTDIKPLALACIPALLLKTIINGCIKNSPTSQNILQYQSHQMKILKISIVT